MVTIIKRFMILGSFVLTVGSAFSGDFPSNRGQQGQVNFVQQQGQQGQQGVKQLKSTREIIEELEKENKDLQERIEKEPRRVSWAIFAGAWSSYRIWHYMNGAFAQDLDSNIIALASIGSGAVLAGLDYAFGLKPVLGTLFAVDMLYNNQDKAVKFGQYLISKFATKTVVEAAEKVAEVATK